MRNVKDVRFRQPGRLSHIRRGQTTRFRHSHDGNGPDIVDKSVFSCVLVSARLSRELTLKADSSTVERLYLTQRRMYGSIPAPPTISLRLCAPGTEATGPRRFLALREGRGRIRYRQAGILTLVEQESPLRRSRTEPEIQATKQDILEWRSCFLPTV